MGMSTNQDKEGNITGIKGNGNGAPLLVAHMDTFKNSPPDSVHFCNNWMIALDATGRQTYLGADDRAGVYAVLAIADVIPNVMVLFCVDEEIGCIGSSCFDVDSIPAPGIMLSFDRRGKSDAIDHTNGVQVCSKAFKHDVLPVLKRFHYAFETGSCTDIGELKINGIKASALNLSIGYYREHSTGESLNLGHFTRAMNLGLALCEWSKGKSYPHKVKRPKRYGGKEYGKTWYGYDYKRESYSIVNKAVAKDPFYYTKGSGKTSTALDEVYDECDRCGRIRQLFLRSDEFLCSDCMNRADLESLQPVQEND
jgi:hypothetical protein